MAERIDQVCCPEQVIKLITFLRCEASIFVLVCGVINIDFVVRNIKVSNKYHRLFETLNVFREIYVPLLCPVLQSFESVARIGHIHCH